MARRYISPPDVGPTFGVYNKAIRVGDAVYVSGQVSWDAQGKVIGPGNIEAQAERVFRSIGRLLDEAGASPDDVVRTRIFLARAEDIGEVGRAHADVFANVRPATAGVVVQLLDPRWLVEIEADAVIG